MRSGRSAFNGACILLFLSLGITSASAEAPPSASEVIRAVLANRDMPLSVDPSCISAPIDAGARTIGDYFSQLVAALQDERFRPGIEMSVRIEKTTEKGEWQCDIMFAAKDAESPWHYGLSFRMTGTPLRAVPKSFRCPGV